MKKAIVTVLTASIIASAIACAFVWAAFDSHECVEYVPAQTVEATPVETVKHETMPERAETVPCYVCGEAVRTDTDNWRVFVDEYDYGTVDHSEAVCNACDTVLSKQ